jgi:NADH-quinone oxidoreductase subunit L
MGVPPVVLLSRLAALGAAVPLARSALVWAASITVLVAALAALSQRDVQRVLGWSTVSQLGMALVSAALGAYTTAVFQLAAHAVLKALLVLAMGSVSLALRGERSLEHMGGLRKRLPWTHAAFLIGGVWLALLPVFAAGRSFWVIEHPGGLALAVITGLGVALTGTYLARLYLLVFGGRLRAPLLLQRELRESDASILFPLAMLALLSFLVLFIFALPDFIGRWLGIEQANSLRYYLEPAIPSPERFSAASVLLSALLALAGVGVGALFFRRARRLPPRPLVPLAPVLRWVERGYRLDALCAALLGRPVQALARWLDRVVESAALDRGAVEGPGRLLVALSERGLRYAQSGWVQSYLLAMLVGALVLLAWLVRGL